MPAILIVDAAGAVPIVIVWAGLYRRPVPTGMLRRRVMEEAPRHETSGGDYREPDHFHGTSLLPTRLRWSIPEKEASAGVDGINRSGSYLSFAKIIRASERVAVTPKLCAESCRVSVRILSLRDCPLHFRCKRM